jgi:Rod binding domain-containing protein
MNMDSTLSALSSLPQIDARALNSGDQAMRIKQVSKAMESIFTSQLTAELGKSIDASDDSSDSDSGPYSDFIQQAMTQGVTQGGGLGLAKTIENYLNHRNQTVTGHMPLKTPNTSYHVNRAD